MNGIFSKRRTASTPFFRKSCLKNFESKSIKNEVKLGLDTFNRCAKTSNFMSNYLYNRIFTVALLSVLEKLKIAKNEFFNLKLVKNSLSILEQYSGMWSLKCTIFGCHSNMLLLRYSIMTEKWHILNATS